ncbi:hypothetical protein AAZV13_14G083300 [Glycine max]
MQTLPKSEAITARKVPITWKILCEFCKKIRKKCVSNGFSYGFKIASKSFKDCTFAGILKFKFSSKIQIFCKINRYFFLQMYICRNFPKDLKSETKSVGNFPANFISVRNNL